MFSPTFGPQDPADFRGGVLADEVVQLVQLHCGALDRCPRSGVSPAGLQRPGRFALRVSWQPYQVFCPAGLTRASSTHCMFMLGGAMPGIYKSS